MKRNNVFKLSGLTAAIIFSTTTWAEKMQDFEALDQNQDGKLTPSEVDQNPQLTTSWTEIDRDDSDTIDRQEFSAFEEKHQQEAGQQKDKQMQSGHEGAATGSGAAAGATAAAGSQGMERQGRRMDHPLYSMSPEELQGQDVMGADGQKLGTVSKVVSDRSSGRIHVVVSGGGFMGIASRENVFPLDNIQMEGGNLRVHVTEQEVEGSNEYTEDAYVAVEPEDRPISEFAAFEESSTEEPVIKDDVLREPGEQSRSTIYGE